MVRTQIQLPEAQVRAIRKATARDHISMAEFIRRSIDSALQERSHAERAVIRREKALSAIGCVRGAPTDLASNHDDYLTEAYAK